MRISNNDDSAARHSNVFMVAIVGGSGSGKTWLANRLKAALEPEASHLSLDDFYRDCSKVPPERRGHINFDHPRSIDWDCVERVLEGCAQGTAIEVPRYDFQSHCRMGHGRVWEPRRIILVEGLWLLRRVALRRLFGMKIFIDAPAKECLRRRVERDQAERGRSLESVREQFERTVWPMHVRYVAPQAAWADRVVRQPLEMHAVAELAGRIWNESSEMKRAQP